MEAAAHFVPAEEHHGYECRFHEEGQYAFDGQRRSEDVAYKPAVVRPVGAEFKFKDDACGYSAGEIDAEKGHPEFSDSFPAAVACPDVDCFHNGYNH